MKIQFNVKKSDIHESEIQLAEKKITKLNKFFRDEAEGFVKAVQVKNNYQRVELTINSNNLMFRAEASEPEFLDSIDRVIAAITRQIHKNKTKLAKRIREQPPADNSDTEIFDEKEYQIAKKKKFIVNLMSADEAILRMNMLGHEFFIFRNVNSGSMNVVYKRRQGDYGLIETE